MLEPRRSMRRATRRSLEGSALRITAVYLILGALWILFSDRALLALIQDPALLTRVQTWKGWFFVLGSGLVVYALTRNALRAFAAREEADRHLRLIMDTVPTRIAWRDREGGYVGGNANYAREVGLDDPAALGGLVEDDLPRSVLPPALLEDARAVQEGAEPVVGREYPATTAEDRIRWIRGSVVPLRGREGEVAGTLLCYDDVTDEVGARQQLRQAQKVQEIGQLTSGVAHDFNNVLSVIGANVDLLFEGRLDEDETRRALREVRGATRSAVKVVQTLLGMSRQAELEIVPTDVVRVLRGLSVMFSRVLTPAYPYELQVRGEPPPVMADPAMVEQAVLNLITNARDAMGEGGRITVEVEEVVLNRAPETEEPPGRAEGYWTPPSARPLRAGRFVAISVADDGPGIPAETLPSVFQAFYTTKKRGAGTGLGLAMVQGLMEQQGGGVQVRTERSVGTTMRILFPVAAEADLTGGAPVHPVSEDPVAAPDEPAGPGRILIVDDQEDLRRTVGRVLRRYGWDVEEASDGVRALEILDEAEGEIVLVLSDLTMPRMGGMELYRELRRRGMEMPFVVTSGVAELAEVASAEEVAEIPFIAKPWTPTELIRKIRSVT